MIDLDDPRAGKIADILGNKTCKQILGILAEREMSESEIAFELKIALNTVDYNIKNLVGAGLVEESKGFLWSVKGKRVLRYKIARKRIVISPKTSFKGIIPAVLISGLGALAIKYWVAGQNVIINSADKIRGLGAEKAGELSSGSASVAMPSADGSAEIVSGAANLGEPALWFLLGSLIALFVFLAWNWRKIW